ncbi:putative bifunctional diguanylate cyclase/phosphodiesterase [Demequina aestuarii]|uniref:putative bifunctional diguanylate cyclase/phosphodiesterase n=1 Tax=Demequina aestuarii TaxID=327095 RepID=UPI0007818C38|nr:EAL domain-containing protein [Demequina aestuarii]
MGLRPDSGEGDAGARASASFSPLAIYLAVVSTAGLGSVIAALALSPWAALLTALPLASVAFLAVAAIAGEVKPILLVLAGSETRSLSTSAPFVLALIAVGGLGLAIVVQVVSSLADDIVNRREFKKSLFNTAQYALSVLAAGVVYGLLTGKATFGVPESVTPGHVGALLVAGVAMVIVNWFLVAAVVALASGQPLTLVLRTDARNSFLTHLVLLSVGGIAADVASDGVGVLALLAAPVVAAHLFATVVARHAYDAAHDSLTGLGNRGQLDSALTRALRASQHTTTQGPGLVLLDLDHFKDFNDTLGHPVGDTILRDVAERLRNAVPDGGSVHRLGGDEFAVVVNGGLADSRRVARDLLAALDAPIRIESLELLVRSSAGVAVAPMHGTDAETLMKNSDIALYHAKLERDRISTYSPEYDVNTVERLQLLADLRSALDSQQLRVVYQPQVDLNSRRTVAVEALVRWDHPTRGTIAPDDFIPLAENSGLIFPVTHFVLDAALAQLAKWREAGHQVRVAVNLSARHLSDVGLAQQIYEALARHQIPPSALVLEITETGILSDTVRADMVIRAVRGIGVEIAIDDYGTGNASLSYLKRLQIDELKVDRSFVSNIGSDHHDLIIVRSTIALALALDLRVVAEGIEDDATAEALAQLGGVIGQGYHLGSPASVDEISQRLDLERRTAPTARGAGR